MTGLWSPVNGAAAHFFAPGFRGPTSDESDLLTAFVAETRELINEAESALVALEVSAADVDAQNRAFRALHTVKGTAACLPFNRLADLAHRTEDLLARIRDGEIAGRGGFVDLLLHAFDTMRVLLDRLERSGHVDGTDEPHGFATLLSVLADPASAGVSEVSTFSVALQAGHAMAQGLPSTGISTRVRTEHLIHLQQLIDDLLVTHERIARDPAVSLHGSRALARDMSRARQLGGELHTLTETIRSVSIRTAFQQIVRYASDVARKCGKSVVCTVSGDDIHVDRFLVELLADPFVHMVRNAIDHGLEAAEERALLGKPPTGSIQLRCRQTADAVIVQLSDDGRGFSRERIAARAVEMGLVPSTADVPDEVLWGFVFAPGFTTVSEATALSGRGVGMDVVQRNVEAAGGRISIDTSPGQGTTFTLTFPIPAAQVPTWRGPTALAI